MHFKLVSSFSLNVGCCFFLVEKSHFILDNRKHYKTEKNKCNIMQTYMN